MKILSQISCLFFCAILFVCLGCTPQPNETPYQQPKANETNVLPIVSPEKETVVEPTPPVEEPVESPKESSLEEATAVPQTPQNPTPVADVSDSVQLPKVSDLVPQVEAYVAKLEKKLGDLEGASRFVDDADLLYRDANTLALIALALGLSEEENPYKKAAPAIIQAAMKMDSVKNFDEATQVIAEIKQSLTAEADSASLGWEKKLVSLTPTMKAVVNTNTLVKRNLRTEAALQRGSRVVAEGSAVMAVIAQGNIPNANETTKPDAVREWTAHCLEFRDAALTLNQAASDFEAEKGTFDAVQTAYEALADSCDSCHKLFYNGEAPKI